MPATYRNIRVSIETHARLAQAARELSAAEKRTVTQDETLSRMLEYWQTYERRDEGRE